MLKQGPRCRPAAQVVALKLRSAGRADGPLPSVEAELDYPTALNRALPEVLGPGSQPARPQPACLPLSCQPCSRLQQGPVCAWFCYLAGVMAVLSIFVPAAGPTAGHQDHWLDGCAGGLQCQVGG